MKYNNLTRPSALGMLDPISGPFIHNFVTEKQNQLNNENSVNSKNSEKKTQRRQMRELFGEEAMVFLGDEK